MIFGKCSLPTPDSPMMSTLKSVIATCIAISIPLFRRGLLPMILNCCLIGCKSMTIFFFPSFCLWFYGFVGVSAYKPKLYAAKILLFFDTTKLSLLFFASLPFFELIMRWLIYLDVSSARIQSRGKYETKIPKYCTFRWESSC